MQSKGYLIFHLNLAFSSIEEAAWPTLIKTCYHPLLDLAEINGIPIGIEVSGWTLKQIARIDPIWIERFKKSLESSGNCELIGSGYCQIIGPLAPAKVNDWNQKLGLSVYNEILGRKPDIVLVNEMAYSNSLVELYVKHGYKGFIMDRDNIRLALNLEGLPISEVPSHALGAEDATLPILWADSILFQKLQQYVHGDISVSDYMDYLTKRLASGEVLIPIYSNDAEVFDHRPGRFSEERACHPDGEWHRMINLLKTIKDQTGIEWVTPMEALRSQQQHGKYKLSRLSSSAHPIPVKKQAKYNIARWAVTGRDDTWLNTMCHRVAKNFTDLHNHNSEDWRELCELWSSDLRTHITEIRWEKAKLKLENLLNRHDIHDHFGYLEEPKKENDNIQEALGSYGGCEVSLDEAGILLKVSTQNLSLELNLRRGLAIQNLSFGSHGMLPSIVTLRHGYFSSIALGADYYSGNTIVELPIKRRRVTDLEQVKPSFFINANGDVEIHATVVTPLGSINKVITVSASEESIGMKYSFSGWEEVIGSIRVGTLTFSPEFINGEFSVLCQNGGAELESFDFAEDVSLGTASSTLVSSTSGLGATTGEIIVGKDDRLLNLRWNQFDCAVMPIVQHKVSPPGHLSRISFSMLEIDDTLKSPVKLGSFELTISAGHSRK